MTKQTDFPNDEGSERIDGLKSYNRNANKWSLAQDEILSNAIDKLRQAAVSKGERFSKDKALRVLARDKALLRKLPAVGGAHRVTDTPEKTHARLAKRAQQPTVKAPGIARALGLGEWDLDAASLRRAIIDATAKHLKLT
jgi:hypothetical protein